MTPFVLARGALREPWRLWTCHAVHFGTWHLLVNLAALAVPFVLLPARLRGRAALGLLVLAPFLSLALLPTLGDGTYRGASGLACAAWAMAGFQLAAAPESRREGLVLLGILALKVAAETWAGASVLPAGPGWATLPAAHLWGMILGAAWGPLLGARAGGR